MIHFYVHGDLIDSYRFTKRYIYKAAFRLSVSDILLAFWWTNTVAERIEQIWWPKNILAAETNYW